MYENTALNPAGRTIGGALYQVRETRLLLELLRGLLPAGDAYAFVHVSVVEEARIREERVDGAIARLVGLERELQAANDAFVRLTLSGQHFWSVGRRAALAREAGDRVIAAADSHEDLLATLTWAVEQAVWFGSAFRTPRMDRVVARLVAIRKASTEHNVWADRQFVLRDAGDALHGVAERTRAERRTFAHWAKWAGAGYVFVQVVIPLFLAAVL